MGIYVDGLNKGSKKDGMGVILMSDIDIGRLIISNKLIMRDKATRKSSGIRGPRYPTLRLEREGMRIETSFSQGHHHHLLVHICPEIEKIRGLRVLDPRDLSHWVVWLKVHRASHYVVSAIDYTWGDDMRGVIQVSSIDKWVTFREIIQSGLTKLNLLQQPH